MAHSYDAAGNLTQKAKTGETWDYVYNALGQLVQVKLDGQIVANFQYDALGRLMKSWGNAVDYKFYRWSGGQVLLDLDKFGNITAHYTWGPGSDNLLVVSYGNNSFYPVQDQQGTVAGLLDRDTTYAAKYVYGAWGEMWEVTGHAVAFANRYRYTGRAWFGGIGLYYYRARWYDPEQGRFTQEDPAGGANLYAYVSGDPMNARDPSGMVAQDWYQTVVRIGTLSIDLGPGFWQMFTWEESVGAGSGSGVGGGGFSLLGSQDPEITCRQQGADVLCANSKGEETFYCASTTDVEACQRQANAGTGFALPAEKTFPVISFYGQSSFGILPFGLALNFQIDSEGARIRFTLGAASPGLAGSMTTGTRFTFGEGESFLGTTTAATGGIPGIGAAAFICTGSAGGNGSCYVGGGIARDNMGAGGAAIVGPSLGGPFPWFW